MSERARAKGDKPVPRAASARGQATDQGRAAVVFSPYVIRRHREQLAKWVTANGIEPNDVPDHHPLRVEEGTDGPVIRYRAYVRSEQGRVQSDPIHSGEALTEERTAPCTVPPPDLGASQAGEADA